MRRATQILRNTAVSFYDDQMTHHAAALTYYGLMSLFPALLLGVSLLGLLGEYPATYEAVVAYLRPIVPDTTLNAVDSALQNAFQAKGSAATALAVATVIALYGTTGVLEAARRALNVVFEVERGRRFLRRKAIDIASSVVLVGLVLLTLTFVFVGERLARELLGPGFGDVWAIARWPAAVLVTVVLFSSVYYVTPDVHHHRFRWMTPGAIVAVTVWMLASWGFGRWIDNVAHGVAIYGAFASAIVLVAWLWLTNVALLFGAELDAAIDRERGFLPSPVP